MSAYSFRMRVKFCQNTVGIKLIYLSKFQTFFELHLGHLLIRSECFVKIVPHSLHFPNVMPVTIQQNSMDCI